MTSDTAPRRFARAIALLTGATLSLAAFAQPGIANAAPPTPPPPVTQIAKPGPTLAAPPTLAGSLVFIKSNNVWISNGNGTGAHAVTTDGTAANPYRSPSESDTGIIAASRFTDIVRMTQKGVVLNRFDPPALRNSAGEPVDGAPVDVSISPNGARIAYTFTLWSCPAGADCMYRSATGYSLADHYAPAGKPIFYRAPSWITNTRTLTTGGFLSQNMLHDIATTTPVHWFDDSDINFPDTDLADGEVSNDGKWLAEVRGYNSSTGSTTSTIQWYHVNGNVQTGTPPGPPSQQCATSVDAANASPTWAPNAAAVAWQESDGIAIYVNSNPTGCTGAVFLAVPGASRPDWSAAKMS